VSDVPYLYRLTVATEIDACRERLAQGKIFAQRRINHRLQCCCRHLKAQLTIGWAARPSADVLTDEGQYSEAEQLFRQTLDAKRRTLGPEHPSTLNAVDGLARLLKNEKRYPEAEEAYRQAFAGRGRVLGAGHPDTASTAYGLACVLALGGKRDEAFSNLQFAVEHKLSSAEREGLEKNTDLKSLHGDPRFDALLVSSRQRAAAVPTSN
jgi:tetratricopeptide (TPR) repeat protein